MSIIQGNSKTSAAGGYTIEQSIRFDSVRNSELYRTLSGDGNLKTGTFSFWMKRSGLGSLQEIFTTYSIRSSFFFQSNDTLSMQIYNGASYTTLTTTAVFRDTSAFGHYLFRWDTTQATDTDRLQFYYNGVLQTVTGTYPAQNSTTTFSDATYTHVISGDGPANTVYEIDGYLAEIHYVDGTALEATDFGEVNADTGQWVPIEYTNAAGYGSNGFYITGADSADLGADQAGSNDFTSANLTSDDSVLDSPTDNFCTLNAIDKATQVTLADGNLKYGLSTNNYTAVRGTFGVSSGKWYWEMTAVSGMGVNTAYMGIATNASNLQRSSAPTDGTAYTYNSFTGNKAYTSNTSYGDTWNTNGRVIGVALDLDAGKIWWSRDGVFQASGDPAAGTNEAFSGITGTWHPYIVFNDTSPNFLFNFGQSAFTYTPPTGFNALSTASLDTPTIADPSAYFQTTLYTGNGSTQEVNQSGNSTFEPGLVWIKTRSNAAHNALFDQVRGVSRQLRTDNTGVEYTAYSDLLTAFDADGFTLGADTIVGNVNVNTYTYVAWQWLADGTSGSSNTDGDVTSTVSVNTTAGFSICKFNPGTGAQTWGHGLGVAPAMVIVKNLQDITNYQVYHQATGAGGKIFLNATNAFTADTNMWDNTAPTSSVVTTGAGLNTAHDHTAYCFAEVEGFSKFGSYTGNGSSNGAFIALPFRPALFMLKRYDGTGAWLMFDDKREGYNVDNDNLRANTTDTEQTDDFIDIVSNGVKIRTTNSWLNASGGDYLYMAFASSPFRYANAR